MTINEEIIRKLIEEIRAKKESNVFKNYIEYIRFPFYKNLENDTRITFDFPLTVFTGQNGSGKSSVLHAIQGAPDRESPTKFWFSTQVDPIVEGNGQRNCFVYGYFVEPDNAIQEVVKIRISDLKYSKELDLWETSRPLVELGMQKLPDDKRTPPIKKPVRFLDFRAELSAYDKFFYFSEFNKTKTVQTKQDYIRKYSWKVKDIIDNNSIQVIRGIKKNEKVILLSVEAIDAINKILGKKYTKCKLIKHSLFRNPGLTVYFETDEVNYSEAFAGRGEFAVVKLVYEVLSAPEYCLVVLDEPEVSLHPGAQEELKIFLLKQVLKKRLQVIISTHAFKIVEHLPSDSIKLFYQGQSKKFIIKNDTHSIEAFHFIGQNTTNKNNIFVEDKLAKMLLEKVLLELDGEYALLFEIVYHPGGSTEIVKKSSTYSEENEYNKFMLLDGDQRIYIEKINPKQLAVSDIESLDNLKIILKRATNIEFEKLGFRLDSSNNNSQKIEVGIKCLNFLYTNLNFFPGVKNPESLIWMDDYADNLLKVNGISNSFLGDSKSNFYEFAKLYFEDGSESSILSAHRLFVNEFCKRRNDDFLAIVDILKGFKSSIK